LRQGDFSRSGCLAAFLVGVIVTASNLCHFAALFTFFSICNKATKFRSDKKTSLNSNYKTESRRNAMQVIANGLLPSLFSALYVIDCGTGERPIDFTRDYKATSYTIAILASLCCSCGDTLASELGTVLGNSKKVFHITQWKLVPKGTNGGISLFGTLASAFGGFAIGLAFYVTLKFTTFTSKKHLAIVYDRFLMPPQWPIIIIASFSGFLGSLIDSILGGYFQYSGFNRKTQSVVNSPNSNATHISGYHFLSNNQVNFVSECILSALIPYVALRFYEYIL